MSFVDVSPSTLTMLKVSRMTSESAVCKSSGAIAMSVVMKQSIVAMFG